MVDLFGAESVQRAANVSPCGMYRYWLTRWWSGSRLLPIIMLNPSTADAEQDDPTIRRCMSFARREGCGGIRVLNLFAFRATSPADMRAAADPVGPENDGWLEAEFFGGGGGHSIVAAWGAHGEHLDRGRRVRRMAEREGVRLVCLGSTAAGHPRHPLYVKGDQPFVPLDGVQHDRVPA